MASQNFRVKNGLEVGGVVVIDSSGAVNASSVVPTANDGISSNSSGIFVVAGQGLVVNTDGVHIQPGNSQLTANASGLYIDQTNIDHDSLSGFVVNEHIDHHTVYVSGGNGLTGSGDITANVTVSVQVGNNQLIANASGLFIDESTINHNNLLNYIANEHIDHSNINISGGNGLTGTGDLTANVTVSVNPGNNQVIANSSGLFIDETNISHDNLSGFVANEHVDHSTIYVSGGSGLSGSGDITANVSIAINAGNSQIVANSSGLFLDETQISHDNLAGFVANEHIDHSAVILTAGAGLSGGGDITLNRTFDVVAGNSQLISNSSGVFIDQANIDHDNLSNFVGNEHIDHSTINIQPGNGLSGGGDITANVAFAVTGGTGVTSNSSGVHIGQDVATTANVTFNKVDVTTDVLISGNLTVTGTTTQVSSTDLIVNDAIITLASGQASGALNSGIEVDRGSDANVTLQWTETSDKWQLTENGTNFYDIHHKGVDIALGTDTSGNYVATLTAGNGISGSASSEGATPTIAVVAGNSQVVSNSSGVFIDETNINHDNLSGFVANEHIDHSTIYVSGGNGLTGSGDITANVSISVQAGNSQVVSNSSGLFIDETNINHDNLSGFVANEHIDHSTVNIIGGNGLSGSGDITANVTINVQAGNSQIVSNSSGVFVIESQIDHDQLSGFVANEHIDHSTINLTAGNGLSGGGDITANVAFAVTAGNNQVVSNSTGVFIDETNINHDNLAGFVANEHIDHSTVNIQPGNGLSGGGDITANVAFSVVAGNNQVVSNSSGVFIDETNISHDNLSGFVANEHVDHSAIHLNAGDGLAGGGTITANVTFDIVANSGIVSNTNGVFVNAQDGLVANAAGVYVTAGNNQVVSNSSGVFIDETNINHDNLSGFVANEHIDHTAVDMTAGDGLSGGGDISATRTFNVVANNGLVSNSSGVFVAAGNSQVVSNSSGVFIDQSQIDHDSLSGFVANEHIDHSAVEISAGNGLNGGGDLTATRTLNVVAGNGQVISNSSGIFINETTIQHDNLAGFVANEHIDHSAINIIAGNGLDGTGAITANVTLNVQAGNSQLVTNSTGIWVDQSQIDHDSLNGFVSNEHIDHTQVTFTAGDGLTGGGDISGNRTFAVGQGIGISVNSTAVSVDAGTGVTVNSTGVHIGQAVETTSDVTFANVSATNLSGNGTSVTSVDAITVGSNSAADLRSYSDTQAGAAYTNATSYADTAAGTAYSNATSYADTAAGTAYSNATSYADTAAGTAYSNATSYADTAAGTAYSNATSYADTAAGTAYSNAVSDAAADATSKAATAYSNATSYADTAAGTAYTNAIAIAANADNITSGTVASARLPSANATVQGAVTVLNSVTNTSITIAAAAAAVKNAYDRAIDANTRAASAQTAAASAYTNATSYASNADNISSGTLSGARIQANNGIVGNSSGVFVDAGTGVTVNSTGVHIGQDVSTTADVLFNTVETSGSLVVGGNLTVTGNSVTISTQSLAVKDNMLYMNQGIAANITGITLAGNATHLIFTADNNFANGWDVSVTGVTPSSFNGSYENITEANATHFIVANTNSDTYVSGGIARGKTDSNPDLGWAAGYNDGTYAHAGMFRDATDGTFKVFYGYTPEPDASVFIDTGHASFKIANFQANAITAATFSGNGASVTSVNAATVGGNTAATLRTYSDTTAATAYSNATSYADTAAGTAYSNAVSTAASDATTKADTAYSNAVSAAAADATTKAGTAYSNATSFASNASNISSGTLNNARLPSSISVTSLTSTGNTKVTGDLLDGSNRIFRVYDSANNVVWG